MSQLKYHLAKLAKKISIELIGTQMSEDFSGVLAICP